MGRTYVPPVFDPMPWRSGSACANSPHPSLFFSDDKHSQRAMIDSYCNQCPHTSACLDMAMKNNERGVWGGTTEQERQTIRRQRSMALGHGKPGPRHGVRGTAQCGTDSGYHRHRRNGQPICDDCREGHAAAERDRLRRAARRRVA